jgi:hypothetical protein
VAPAPGNVLLLIRADLTNGTSNYDLGHIFS